MRKQYDDDSCNRIEVDERSQRFRTERMRYKRTDYKGEQAYNYGA